MNLTIIRDYGSFDRVYPELAEAPPWRGDTASGVAALRSAGDQKKCFFCHFFIDYI